jgi:hypothetical protein
VASRSAAISKCPCYLDCRAAERPAGAGRLHAGRASVANRRAGQASRDEASSARGRVAGSRRIARRCSVTGRRRITGCVASRGGIAGRVASSITGREAGWRRDWRASAGRLGAEGDPRR